MTAVPGIRPPHLETVRDGDRVLGYLAIDTTVRGRSLGGLRLTPDLGVEEIVESAGRMTLKYGLAGLPQGGAKAGVVGDPEAPVPERRRRLAAFGAAIADHLRSRTYQPDTDMGTSADDIRHMLATVGAVAGAAGFRTDRSGHYTALTALAGAREALARRSRSIDGATVAIEGFGAVGGSLARLLHGAGARVVAVSTSAGAIHDERGLDIPVLSGLADRAGSRAIAEFREAERIDHADLLRLPVDLLAPCARAWSIREDVADGVRARTISGGANAPLTAGAEDVLAGRGVLVVPDFVASSGGVIGGTMAFAAVGERRIERFLLDHWGDWIGRLLDGSEQAGVAPRELAARIARARFEEVRRRSESPDSRRRLLDVGVQLHRRRLLPRRLVGALAPRWIERSIAPPPAGDDA